MTSPHEATGESARPAARCSFCGYAIPRTPLVLDDANETFCSEACADAFEERDGSFAGHHGYKRLRTGVEALDATLPRGVPANAAILLSGEAGTRRTELYTELVWRALARGEPAVVVSFDDPPAAVVERFLDFDWNVLPAIERDDLRLLDCRAGGVDGRNPSESGESDWFAFLSDTIEDAVVDVDDPGDVEAVLDTVEDVVDEVGMSETGLIVVDSLSTVAEAVGGNAGPTATQGENDGRRAVREFVATLKAGVCTPRFVPAFVVVDAGESALRAAHFDGVIDMWLDGNRMADERIPRLSVRKMVGTPHDPGWVTYESAGGSGLVPTESVGNGGRTGEEPFRSDG